MAKQSNILHIGHAVETRDNWTFLDIGAKQEDYEAQLAAMQEIKAFEVVLVQTPYSDLVQSVLMDVSTPFNTYIDSGYFDDAYAAMSNAHGLFYRPIDAASQEALLTQVQTMGFSGQYGDEILPRDVLVNPTFNGCATYRGNQALRLEGEFGDSYEPLLNWKTVLLADKDKATEIWPEFAIQGDVSLKYTFRVGHNGSVDNIEETYVYTDEELDAPFIIPVKAYNAFVTVSIQAKGSGTVRIGAVHKRWSRLGYGAFIFGGSRFSDEQRQEFISYFHPGDLKPPLNVYFSGYRPAEGFEAFYLMKKLNAPFLLFGDPRTEGGAFYKGSETYEQAITQTIRNTLEKLGFKSDELIMSGLSMGSFGALYYSSVLNPRAVIVGKPLVNMGYIAANMRLVRPNDFGTMLDVLLTNEEDNSEAAIDNLNSKFWQQLSLSDLSQTTFAIAYMQQDDYDPYAYDDLVDFLGNQHAKIISRGIPGRHNDDTPTIANWFTNFYRILLKNEFGR